MKIFALFLILPTFVNSFNFVKPNTKLKQETFIPDFKKRELMNIILLNSVALSCGPLLGGYLYFFMPKIPVDINNGAPARDRNNLEVNDKEWLKEHPFPSRGLVEGINGDPHYLITTSSNTLEKYAINAICTHLGCVVPWVNSEQKYICPCHGSQYDSKGKVIRGPAPKSLKLANVDIKDNKILIKKWEEEDFRDGSPPWWI